MMKQVRTVSIAVFLTTTALSLFVPFADAKSQCGLPCQNGGVCHSPRRLESTTLHRRDNYAGLLEQQKPYCQCPVGFTGVLCEVKYVLCSDGQDTCFNGKPCKREVDGFGTEFFRCECDVSNSDLSLPASTKFCEHESTVFCNIDADKKDQHPVSEMAKGSFCKNGGRCKDKNSSSANQQQLNRYGCECKPGFSGSHCETNNNPQIPQTLSSLFDSTASSTKTNSHRRWFRTLVAFVLFLLAFFAIGMAMLIRMENQRQGPSRKKRQSAQERAKIPKGSPINEIELT